MNTNCQKEVTLEEAIQRNPCVGRHTTPRHASRPLYTHLNSSLGSRSHPTDEDPVSLWPRHFRCLHHLRAATVTSQREHRMGMTFHFRRQGVNAGNVRSAKTNTRHPPTGNSDEQPAALFRQVGLGATSLLVNTQESLY